MDIVDNTLSWFMKKANDVVQSLQDSDINGRIYGVDANNNKDQGEEEEMDGPIEDDEYIKPEPTDTEGKIIYMLKTGNFSDPECSRLIKTQIMRLALLQRKKVHFNLQEYAKYMGYLSIGSDSISYTKTLVIDISRDLNQLILHDDKPIIVSLGEILEPELLGRMVDGLEVSVTSMYGNNPGSFHLQMGGEHNEMCGHKEIMSGLSQGFNLYEFANTCKKLYSHTKREVEFQITKLWHRYAPKTIQELEIFVEEVYINKIKHYKLKKNAMTMITMAHLTLFHDKVLSKGTLEYLSINGDMFYYEFDEKKWIAIRTLVESILHPVDMSKLEVYIRPMYYRTWSLMYESPEIKEIMNKTFREEEEEDGAVVGGSVQGQGLTVQTSSVSLDMREPAQKAMEHLKLKISLKCMYRFAENK